MRPQLRESLKSLRGKAERGDASAQFNLGVMYAKGQGVPQDYGEAVRWYRKAVEQGDAAVQFYLGVSYYRGQGVPQDSAEAARWYRKAAEQGNASAQSFLAFMYESGQGVPQDYVEAHMWSNLAGSSASGDTAKRLRDLLAEKMSPQQIAEAQRRAREWKPKTGADKGGGPMK